MRSSRRRPHCGSASTICCTTFSTHRIFGGVLTLLLIQFRLLPLPAALARQPWILRLHEKGAGVPYGIALAAAALAVYPETGWLSSLGV